jgi:hypothetical protein
MITGRGPIDIISLVMCIAAHVGVLENCQVTYFPLMEAYQLQVGLEHFVQGHLMREGPGNSSFMCYHGYDRNRAPMLETLPLLGQATNFAGGEKGSGSPQCCWSGNTKPSTMQQSTGSGRTIVAAAPGRDFPAGWTVYDTHELQGHLQPLYSLWLDRRRRQHRVWP